MRRSLADTSFASEDASEDGGFDVGRFEQAAKHFQQRQGKNVPAKDVQGKPTRLQHNRDSAKGPLSNSGEAFRPATPLGYRLMSDVERVHSLDELKSKLAHLDDQYRRLPLRIETESQRRQQETLRTRIAETEKAVNVFSRPSVLVEI